MNIGLIGLGNIGFHFGTRLLAAGFGLYVYDKSAEAQARLEVKGAKPCVSAKALASEVEIVLLCLPMPQIVFDITAEVVKGKKVRIVLDLSTTGPSTTKEVNSLLQLHHIALVSSPVSGGPVGAEKGTLTVMPAGPASAYKEIEPLLGVLGKHIFYIGADPTLGQTMKIINNTMYATAMLASCEALVYGVKAGLDPQTMLDIVNVSSGRSYATMERIPQCVLDRSFPVRFTTELLYKDVKMCLHEAEKIGATMIVSQAARQFLAFAVSQGDGNKDNTYPIRHFEQWAGVEFGKNNLSI